MDQEPNEQKGWHRFKRLKIQKGAIRRRARKIETATVKHAHRFLTRRWTNMRDVGRYTAGWLVLVGLLILLATVQTAWFAGAYTTQAPDSGGTYAEGVIGVLDTMNPLFASTPAELSVTKLVFSGLLRLDRDNQLQPDAAASWSVSNDGKIYTVQLRSDVYWHDGSKLTVDDVIFTTNLIQNIFVKANQYGTLTGVKVEKISNDEVRFILPSVYAPFAQALTFGILPEHLLKDVKPTDLRENEFGRKPVGTGPFTFRQLQVIDPSRQRLVVHMDANDRYYRGDVRLNHFQLHTYENRDTLKKALVTNEINAALGLGADQIETVVQQNKLLAANNVLYDGVFALFNNDQPLLKDAQIRKALVLGTDQKAVIAAIKGRGVALDGPLPDQFITGDIVKQASFNRQTAQETLETAGWKLSGDVRKKDGTTLQISLVAPDAGDYALIANELVKQWQSIGIAARLQLADTTTIASDYLQPRAYDVLLYELAVGADPDVYPYWHSSQANAKGLNFANYRSGLADDALSSARSRLDPALRAAKYKTFYEQWVKDIPAISLYQPFISYATAKNTTSLEASVPLADLTARYEDVASWAISKTTVYTTR